MKTLCINAARRRIDSPRPALLFSLGESSVTTSCVPVSSDTLQSALRSVVAYRNFRLIRNPTVTGRREHGRTCRDDGSIAQHEYYATGTSLLLTPYIDAPRAAWWCSHFGMSGPPTCFDAIDRRRTSGLIVIES
jgi:hypothetical protein